MAEGMRPSMSRLKGRKGQSEKLAAARDARAEAAARRASKYTKRRGGSAARMAVAAAAGPMEEAIQRNLGQFQLREAAQLAPQVQQPQPQPPAALSQIQNMPLHMQMRLLELGQRQPQPKAPNPETQAQAYLLNRSLMDFETAVANAQTPAERSAAQMNMLRMMMGLAGIDPIMMQSQGSN